MNLYRLPTSPQELMNGRWEGGGDRIDRVPGGPNFEARCPGGLILDLSESMRPHVEDVARAYARALEKLKADSLTGMRVELCLVRCAGDVPTVLQDFQPVGETFPPELAPTGGTPLGASILMMGQLIEARRSVYDAEGLDYHPAIILAVTDGGPTESSHILEQARSMIAHHEESRIASYFPIVTDGADKETIAYLFRRSPRRLKEDDWEQLFAWFVKSLRIVSSTRVGDRIQLPPTDDWSTL